MIEQLKTSLRENWLRFGLGAELPRRLDWLLLGSGSMEHGKVNILFFADRDRTPAVVAKVARFPQYEATVRNEFERLVEFHRHGGQIVRETVPKPIALQRIGADLVLLEGPVRGRPMSVDFNRPRHVSDPDKVAADFALASKWLTQFHQETRNKSRAGTNNGVAPLLHVVRQVTEAYPVTAEDRTFWQAVETQLAALPADKITGWGVHGDFWHGNVLTEGGSVTGVVDWELSELNGSALVDIFMFPTSYALSLARFAYRWGGKLKNHPSLAENWSAWRAPNNPYVAGFSYCYCDENWFAEVVRRYLEEQFERYGWRTEWIPMLLTVYLAHRMTRELRYYGKPPSTENIYWLAYQAYKEHRANKL